MTRKQIIQNLRNKRYTYQQIGNFLNISRQRVHQIFTGYCSPANKKKPMTEIRKEWFINLPEGIDTKGLGNWDGRDMLREIVRRRDNWTCQICSKVWEKGMHRFDVHHINCLNSQTEAREYKNNKDFQQMITLCHKCHLNLKEHKMRKKVIHS